MPGTSGVDLRSSIVCWPRASSKSDYLVWILLSIQRSRFSNSWISSCRMGICIGHRRVSCRRPLLGRHGRPQSLGGLLVPSFHISLRLDVSETPQGWHSYYAASPCHDINFYFFHLKLSKLSLLLSELVIASVIVKSMFSFVNPVNFLFPAIWMPASYLLKMVSSERSSISAQVDLSCF